MTTERSADEAARVRGTFRQATDFYLETVAGVPADQWDHPALGVWTVRDLAAHTSRALTLVEQYAATSETTAEITSPAGYYVRAMGSPAVHQQIAERAKEAGAALGDDPAAALRAAVERGLGLIESLPDSRVIKAAVGTITLIDFLPTRVVELVVHSLDIASALGVDAEPPEAPMEMTLRLLADIAVQSGRGPVLALAATGRTPLPQGFSVLD